MLRDSPTLVARGRGMIVANIVASSVGYNALRATPVLAQIDDLASQALGWVQPIEFSIARSDAEREVAYRLRCQAVIDHGWMQPADLPDGREHDAYDDRAVHILARRGDAPVATARLVFPQNGLRLPTEEAFDLTIEPRGQVVDAGRFVVARESGSIKHRLLAAMLARGWLEVRARGYSIVCAAFASSAMLRVYQRMGLRMRTLGPARRYWGQDRYPILFDVPGSTSALIGRWLSGTTADQA